MAAKEVDAGVQRLGGPISVRLIVPRGGTIPPGRVGVRSCGVVPGGVGNETVPDLIGAAAAGAAVVAAATGLPKAIKRGAITRHSHERPLARTVASTAWRKLT